MSDHAALKAQLIQRLRELNERTMDIEKTVSSAGNPDWEDNAIESEDDDVLMKIGNMTENEIHEIKLAISRIDAGDYGLCVECGKKIAKERLEALPFATTCIACA